ncbi:MAG TPA: Os1348 family NHLP clan protein, partial [Candidatus Methylomirabilis sp.]|nr:Os1348 family NHLP clan protein [Candidatus Methylomirabilis sp.]
FFRDPAHACLQVGIQLTSHEVEALLGVPRSALVSLGARLDDRICRLHLQRSEVTSPGDYGRAHALPT